MRQWHSDNNYLLKVLGFHYFFKFILEDLVNAILCGKKALKRCKLSIHINCMVMFKLCYQKLTFFFSLSNQLL